MHSPYLVQRARHRLTKQQCNNVHGHSISVWATLSEWCKNQTHRLTQKVMSGVWLSEGHKSPTHQPRIPNSLFVLFLCCLFCLLLSVFVGFVLFCCLFFLFWSECVFFRKRPSKATVNINPREQTTATTCLERTSMTCLSEAASLGE